MPKLLSVGLSTLDYLATVSVFPQPDDKMRSESLQILGGGNAANTACGLARCHVQTTLLSGVGEQDADQIERELLDYGVKPQLIQYPGASPFSYILVHKDTRTCIHQAAVGTMGVEDVSELDVSQFDGVHFDCRYPEAAVAVAEACVAAGVPYSVDVERPREGLLELLAQASLVICNSNYDTNDLLKQAPEASVIVQTLGSRGSRVLRGSSNDDETLEEGVSVIDGQLVCECHTPAKVVDTTGAGDAFQAGFLSAYYRKLPLARCLRVGSYLASRKLEAVGARAGLPDYETDATLRELLE